jgi:hypothetical protein
VVVGGGCGGCGGVHGGGGGGGTRNRVRQDTAYERFK